MPLFESFGGRPDGDLVVCEIEGLAYQADRSRSVPYDRAYWRKYQSYDGTPTDACLNAARVALARSFGPTALDIGIGSGSFQRSFEDAGGTCYGYDVNPAAIDWLAEQRRWRDPYAHRLDDIDVVCCWDSLEHMADPDALLRRLPRGVGLCVSLPVFDGLDQVRASKHYRPDEHFTYWTPAGLISYLAWFGYALRSYGTPEVACGREAIGTFAFVRI